MASTKLSVRTTDIGVAQAISDALDGGRTGARCRDAVRGRRRRLAHRSLRAEPRRRASGRRWRCGPRRAGQSPTSALEDLPDLNWVAISQAALPPVIAGRFVVHGSHDRGRIPYGPSAIVVDAGEAFGTAHHATTLGCLLAIDKLARAGRFRRVLDLGCGSGVLAIAARALHARRAGDCHRFRSHRRGGGTRQRRRQRRPPHRHRLCARPRPSVAAACRALRPDHRQHPRRPPAHAGRRRFPLAAPRRQSSSSPASSTRRPLR